MWFPIVGAALSLCKARELLKSVPAYIYGRIFTCRLRIPWIGTAHNAPNLHLESSRLGLSQDIGYPTSTDVFQNELYNSTADVTVCRELRKRLHLKA
jgi:hypothetical protein